MKRPILLVDDDAEDQMLFQKALTEIGADHPLLTFERASQLIDYLQGTTELPFLILSEFKLPGMNGLELRKTIEADPILKKRSIPFIFFTNPVPAQLVEEAYESTVQGIFHKPDTQAELREALHDIIRYWTECLHPNR